MMITPENEKVKASRILSDSSRFPGAGLGDGLRFGFSTVSFTVSLIPPFWLANYIYIYIYIYNASKTRINHPFGNGL